MAQIYDTDKIREAARRIRRLSEQMNGEISGEIRKAESRTEALQGETAEALAECLDRMKRKVIRTGNSLEDIGSRLRAYANALEAADDRIAAQIQGR